VECSLIIGKKRLSGENCFALIVGLSSFKISYHGDYRQITPQKSDRISFHLCFSGEFYLIYFSCAKISCDDSHLNKSLE
jgi:hypothetical protein